MQVAHPQRQFIEVFGEILGHTLGQTGSEHAESLPYHFSHRTNEIIHLVNRRTHLHRRINQSCRANNLLHHHAATVCQFIRPRRGRDMDQLRGYLLKLFKTEWPVVQRRRQAKTIIHQRLLTRPIPFEHATDLRHRNMRFIKQYQCIVGDIVEQRRRRLPRQATRQMARIVLHPAAVPHLLNHLQIELGTLLQTLRLNQTILVMQLRQPLGQFITNGLHGTQQLITRGNKMALGKDGKFVQRLQLAPGQGIKTADAINLITKKLHPDGIVLRLRRIDLQRITAQTKGSTMKIHFITLILELHQLGHHRPHILSAPDLKILQHIGICLGTSQTINTGNRSDNNHILTLQKRPGSGESHAVDLLVNRRILLDEGVALRHIGLWLIIIVVGDEVFHRIVRKKLLKLAIKLCCQRLVGSQNQRRLLHLFDDTGHGVGLARSGNAQQHLMRCPLAHTIDQFRNGAGLIPLGLKFTLQLKFGHGRVFQRPDA